MPEKSGYANIDELQAQVDLETACCYYGVDPGPLQRIGRDLRTQCFLHCGKAAPTGDRAIAIDAASPVKRWRCHQYGCGKGGNLVTLCDLMKPGANCGGQQPKGQRFTEIRDDLRKMAGQVVGAASVHPHTPPAESPGVELAVNLPLAESPNERARELVTLDERFLVEASGKMDRYAAAYLRRHPFLTPDVCRRERCGYLPRPGGSDDRRGGSLQGMWVYCYSDEQGRPLTWFGRSPRFEELHRAWVAAGRQGKEPAKFHFVKGFQRGLEVYGQHAWNDAAVQQRIQELGALLVVEGPNDRIALKTVGVEAFALCSNIITREQAARVASQARELGVPVGLLFDNDPEGENGARLSLALLAEHGPVRFAWSGSMFGGAFKGWQPEQLAASSDALAHVRRHLTASA